MNFVRFLTFIIIVLTGLRLMPGNTPIDSLPLTRGDLIDAVCVLISMMFVVLLVLMEYLDERGK